MLNKDIVDVMNERENRLSDAFQYVQHIKINLKEEILRLSSDINNLRDSKKQLELNVLNIDTMNNNSDFFSPTLKNNKQLFLQEYDKQLDLINNEIKQKIFELEMLKIKDNNIHNVYQCLEDLQIYHVEKVKKSEKSNNIDLDKINRKYGIILLQAQENERKRIARDLHDSTVQSLTNLKHKTELITRLIDMDTVRAKLELQTMIHTLKSTIDEMRNIIYDLRPMSLDDLGLIATINKLINEMKQSYPIDIIFNVSNVEYNVMPVVNLTLFRIIQEAISNALKYSNATTILIKLQYNKGEIYLSVSDNGKGFNIDDINTTDDSQGRINGFGLSIMKERIFLLSGKIDIVSSEGNGTEIVVRVPIELEVENTEDV